MLPVVSNRSELYNQYVVHFAISNYSGVQISHIDNTSCSNMTWLKTWHILVFYFVSCLLNDGAFMNVNVILLTLNPIKTQLFLLWATFWITIDWRETQACKLTERITLQFYLSLRVSVLYFGQMISRRNDCCYLKLFENVLGLALKVVKMNNSYGRLIDLSDVTARK